MDGCQACAAPTDLFLCARCTTALRDMLRGLIQGPFITAVAGKTQSGGAWGIERRTPGLLEHLAEAAIGRVRMGDGGRRTRRHTLVEYTDPKVALDGLGGTEGQRRLEEDAENGRLTESAVLRQGGINPKAARLLEETHQVLNIYVDTFAAIAAKKPAAFAAVPRNSLPATVDMAEWLSC